MASNFWSLQSLRRGLNNTDPPHAIDDEQCTVATNVEFNLSTLGERRKGCADVDLPAAITASGLSYITFMHRHLPTTDETASELWVLAATAGNSAFAMERKTTSWTSITFTDNIETATGAQAFGVQAQTLHGKLFLAYPSVGAVDRLHVVDTSGTSVRRVGMATPGAAPTAADGGGGGSLAGTRYYRTREVVVSGSTVVRRSEASAVLTHVPGGANASVIVTKPADAGENATHWEIEASVDNANFYRMARIVVGTTTHTDSVAYTTGYANTSGSVLSADSGDYTVPHSPKYLTVDEDRLIMAGAWEDSTKASRVSWTPVYGDDGDGNDERIPIDTDNFVDLDGFEGGPITAMSRPVDGAIWVFKKSHTYKLVRTGRRERAYDVVTVSKSLGAIPGSLVEGIDAYGMPCLYFLDPETGPCRTGGARQIQACGRDILETWKTVNLDATQVVARALYYPESRQVHFWIATGSSNAPDLKMVLQTNATREEADGIRGGWSLANGKISEAYAVCMYAENIDDNTTRSLVLRPFVGTTTANEWVLRCDTGTDDDGEAYSARIVTKPFTLRNNLSKFGILGASILMKADASADLNVTLIRDYGLEEPKTVAVTCAATGSETQVIKQLRNLVGMQMYAAQIEFEDPASPDGNWQLQRFDARISENETA